jgi:hypothetical protein
MYMKKNKHEYTTAVNGLEGLEAFKNTSPPFETVFMGKYLFLVYTSFFQCIYTFIS